MKHPFFSIITRTTIPRAELFTRCKASVDAQTFQDVEHVVLLDEVGVGVAEAQKMLHTANPRGEYVFVLDDDDYLTDETVLGRLHVALTESKPDFAVVKVKHHQLGTMPLDWGVSPDLGRITVSNLVVKNAVWFLTRGNFGTRYAGDWDWVASVFAYYEPQWIDLPLVTVEGRRMGAAVLV